MMPLPVPVLDDLTWTGLIEYARDAIPSSGDQWTDHNVHDPGITIMELLAVMCEQVSYRIDQIPQSHRAAFVSLLGTTRAPAVAATAILEATAATPLEISENWELVSEGDGASAAFTVVHAVGVGPTRVIELRVEATSATSTLPPSGGGSFEPLGPDATAALTVALSPTPPQGRFALWFAAAYDDERNDDPTRCRCSPVELSWECADAAGWRPLPADAVDDQTSALRRSGIVELNLPSGGITTIRCRVTTGRYDRAPMLEAVWCNPVVVCAKLQGADRNLPGHPQWRVTRPAPSPRNLTLSTPLGVRRGREAETLDGALGRAAVRLSAHERLVALAAAYGTASLDRVPRDQLIASAVPARAVTLLDLERVAYATPGAELARVRAFADVDLEVACAQAPGTVSVVIVPYLPQGRPEPTLELTACVARHLARHKTLGVRIRVSGPTYTMVDISASVVAAMGTDRVKTQTLVERAIRTFLDPLVGGADGRGWPFGRDVYRTEVMTVVGAVPGVDLVADVVVVTDPCDACPNGCVPDGGLVAIRSLEVEVS